jgi:hypothetical protein
VSLAFGAQRTFFSYQFVALNGVKKEDQEDDH